MARQQQRAVVARIDLERLFCLFMLLLLKVVEPQPWKKAIGTGLITAVASDLVFNLVLGAQIPSGILGF